jgi:phosphoribosylformylglycinamidine synthase
MHAVAEAARKVACTGATPVAATNCLNFGNPEKPEIMAQIVESVEGLAEACSFFEVPVTGGNVSLYNETLGTPIFPTPVVGIVGVMETALPVGVDFKKAGRAVMLMGGLGSVSAREMGGTQYAKNVLGQMWGVPPKLDMALEKRVHETIRELVRGGHVESAHDVGEGGLAVAIAESSFGVSEMGADVSLDSDLPAEWLLFHEGPSRILVSTAEPQKIFAICLKNGVPVMTIGVTLEARVTIRNRDTILIDRGLRSLHDGWQGGLEHLLHFTQPPQDQLPQKLVMV